MLFNTDILQNSRLENVNPTKQIAPKETFMQNLKTTTKVYAVTELS